MRGLDQSPCPNPRRGHTIAELAISFAVVTVLLAALLPMLAGGADRAGVHVSASNLRRISDGCSAYEASWNGRQWSKLDADMGQHNGCYSYSADRCPPTLLLGWGSGGGLWGYWIPGQQQACVGWPGSCGNWAMMMPISLGGSTGSASLGLGTWSLINARGVREYVASRFYDPVFYSPNDVIPYQQLQATHFGSTLEYENAGNLFWNSTYSLSPAAIWGPGVFRAPTDGGFQHPDDLPEAYDVPTASVATHPSLKTRLMERRWCQSPPALQNPAYSGLVPYFSNAGPASTPGAAFFDGHVSFVRMSDFAEDDQAAIRWTENGLWSRDTPIGPDGLSGGSIGGFRNSSHILTTGGITGRDLLKAR